MTTNATKMYVGAGIVLARPDEICGYRFLLLRGRDTGVWSFSKGHPEREDHRSPLCTAARETFEETGLSVSDDYTIYGNSIRFGKRPYWLGIIKPDAKEVTLTPREHSAYAWMSWDEIGQIRGNLDVRAWIKKSRATNGEFQRILAISSGSISDTHSTVSGCI
jgi:8-oxo-dGTP pyrophosphatase MutT (NUDIX family)